MLNENPLRKAFSVLNKIIEVTSVVILVLVSLVVFYSVLLRYVFKSPLAWSEEVARYMFIWMVFLGFSIAEKSGDHFRIEVFIEMVTPKVRLIIEIFLNILIFYALFVLFQEGMNYYQQGKSGLSTILEMPLNLIYIALPISMVLTFMNRIDTAQKQIRALLSQIKGEAETQNT
ncbi:TRAP transporter small permease [Marispirochaeta sp.]|uniref:TRAP transporter small permease n=1 Tax=Marispirochaeta sp. TaxID=2038653 RepID=UPI0029C79DB0|nr:TRAP transporter small permease [Marispirochaeta sp.]